MQVKVQDTAFNALMAQLILLQHKGIKETTRDVAKRFVRQVVRNTPPMIANQSPSATKRAWEQKITSDYEETRYFAGKWYSKSEIHQIINAKKRQLGRMAAGWLKAVEQLQTPAPAWVKRHNSDEGYCRVQIREASCLIIVGNSVPYGRGLLEWRADYSMRRVRQGIEGNIRAMKKRLLHSIQHK